MWMYVHIMYVYGDLSMNSRVCIWKGFRKHV